MKESSKEHRSISIKYTTTLPIKVIGSVGGLGIKNNDNLLVFHRSSRKWELELV